jgi:hypothetical protein
MTGRPPASQCTRPVRRDSFSAWDHALQRLVIHRKFDAPTISRYETGLDRSKETQPLCCTRTVGLRSDTVYPGDVTRSTGTGRPKKAAELVGRGLLTSMSMRAVSGLSHLVSHLGALASGFRKAETYSPGRLSIVQVDEMH